MKVIKTDVPDILILEPKVHQDERGYFFESFKQSILDEQGVHIGFVQDNQVCSSKGVLRGLHYQIAPKAQAKLVRVLRGSIFDVAVDIRRGSPTFGKHVGIKLSAENKKMIFVAEGFAHGYVALEEDTEVLYKVSADYSPRHERGILWSDSSLNIGWPKIEGGYKVSLRDGKLPVFKELEPV